MRRFTKAIERRNQLQKLEKIYQKLLALLESELVSRGIVAESGNKGEERKIPKLTNSKSDNLEKTNRYEDLASQIALLQKNHSLLWNWLVKVVQKVGIGIVEHDLRSGATLA